MKETFVFYYSWQDFEDDVAYLVTQLKPQLKENKYTGIYGIPRGGLVLAVRLSHELELPLFTQECVALMDNKILIADEIADTGKTLEIFRKRGNPIVTLLKNDKCPTTPNFYCDESHDWVHFPWEKR